MPAKSFDIIFSAKLIDGHDPAKVRDRLRQLFKASDAHIDLMFSGKTVVVKKGVDIETAGKYRLVFRQAGALLDIRPSDVGASQPEPVPDTAKTPDLTLAPANTGSLEEFAPKLQPASLPDISEIDMSAAGAVLDETPAPAPAHVDTSDLSMVENAEWTLEDCQPPPLPQVVPNIDDLELAAADDESHIPPDPPPLPLPDISGMTLEAQEDLKPDDRPDG